MLLCQPFKQIAPLALSWLLWQMGWEQRAAVSRVALSKWHSLYFSFPETSEHSPPLHPPPPKGRFLCQFVWFNWRIYCPVQGEGLSKKQFKACVTVRTVKGGGHYIITFTFLFFWLASLAFFPLPVTPGQYKCIETQRKQVLSGIQYSYTYNKAICSLKSGRFTEACCPILACEHSEWHLIIW